MGVKITVSLLGVNARKHGQELVDELHAIIPDKRGFSRIFAPAHIPEDDPRLAKVIARLDEAGLRVSEPGRADAEPNGYMLRRFREYEPSDFEGVQLRSLHVKEMSSACFRRDGLLELSRKRFNKDADIAVQGAGWYVVPRRIKELFESSELKGVAFKPCRLIEGYAEHRRYFDWHEELGDTWWELTSNIVMPPLSDFLEFRDRFGNLMADRTDFSQGCFPREDHFAFPELHYRRADLEQMPEFDLARTFEPFSYPAEAEEHPLVASPKFWEFCEDHGIRIGWRPVRIDT